MRAASLIVGVVLCSAVLAADDHHVDFDIHVDFSRLRTFAIRDGKVTSARPELNNAIIIGNITGVIRSALTSRGLKETSDRPDVYVDFSVDGLDYSVGPFGRATRIEPGAARGGRGQRGQARSTDPQSSQPPGLSEAVLVLDLTAADSRLLIWRGVYRDNERDTSRLAQKLPEDARRVLSEYPPRRNR